MTNLEKLKILGVSDCEINIISMTLDGDIENCFLDRIFEMIQVLRSGKALERLDCIEKALSQVNTKVLDK